MTKFHVGNHLRYQEDWPDDIGEPIPNEDPLAQPLGYLALHEDLWAGVPDND